MQAANVRLQALSNGQYWLQRSDRLEARGRQSGLGLDVDDAYTGQNRDVKTLSGGEKFNASLALALGMTDVIQAHQGGVSIEMMFIDEGFGSLDEESLNKAVATLIDLQKSGRMIGVISHVPELKEAFPAIIEVTKTREGSSRATIRIKEFASSDADYKDYKGGSFLYFFLARLVRETAALLPRLAYGRSSGA